MACRVGGYGLQSGDITFEDDVVCEWWARLKYCGYVLRNPKGTPEEKNEYLFVTDTGVGIYRFSVEP